MSRPSERHGMSHHPLYTTWAGMIDRCSNEEHESYHRYGGRGISVCARWRRSFVAFYKDMGERPFKGAQLDRIDNDGNYEPGNVRWVDRWEQHANRSDNALITHDGRTQTREEWARETGINAQTIKNRIERGGWSVKDALTRTTRKGASRMFLYEGILRSVAELSDMCDIRYPTLWLRLNNGMDVKEAMYTPLRKWKTK